MPLAPVGRIICDLQWQIVELNEGAPSLLGVVEPLGLHIDEVVQPQFGSRLSSVQRFPCSRFRRLRLPDGSTSGFLFHLAGGEGFRTLDFEPTNWAGQALEGLVDGAAATDEEGRVVFANPALARLLGPTPEQILGVSALDIARHIAVDQDDVNAIFTAAMGGRSLSDTYPAQLGDGRQRVLYVRTAPWSYCGCVCGVFWMASDVGEVVDSAGEVAAGIWYRLAAALQHELRNPLQTMQAAVEILRPQVADCGQIALQRLEDQIQAINRLVADRVLAGADEPGSFTTCHLSEVVAAEIEQAASRISLRSLTFGHRPPPDEPLLRLHRPAMGRVFSHLFRNSAQARPEAHISIEYESLADVVLCHVSDDGPGFPAGLSGSGWLEGLRAAGMHLGLAIAASTVEAHGGTLSLGRAPTGGARVTIRVPAADRLDGRSQGPKITVR